MQAQIGDQKLIKAIGVIGLAATIFNCTVGGGIFRLPGTVFGISGAWTPLVHIVCGVVIFFVGICLARVGRGTVTTGGPYAYVGEVYGPYLAMITGVLIWILGTFSMAAVTTALAASVAKLI